MTQCVVGVMLKSQLEQAAGFLDQQINLERAGMWLGESQVVGDRHEGTTSNAAQDPGPGPIPHPGAHYGWEFH